MAEYIGKRIIPRYDGVWDQSQAYEALVIVLEPDTGDSYTSRKEVPAGIPLTNEEYWGKSGSFDAQLQNTYDKIAADNDATEKAIKEDNDATEKAIKEDNDETEQLIRADNDATETAVKEDNAATKKYVDNAVAGAVTLTTQNKAELESRMSTIETRLDANVSASTDKNADYAAEVVDARTSSAGTAYDSLGAHIRAAEQGTAMVKLPAQKVQFPELDMGKFYRMTLSKEESCFSYAYDKETDEFTYTCTADFDGDHIFYGPFITPQQYAILRQMGGKVNLRFKAKNCVGTGKFHLALWTSKMKAPDSTTLTGIIYSPYVYTFQDGEAEVNVAASIAGNDAFTYSDEDACYYYDEDTPVSIAVLLYANHPLAGSSITVAAPGGLLYGCTPNAETLGVAVSMVSAENRTQEIALGEHSEHLDLLDGEVDAVETEARENGKWIDFVPDSVFAPDDSETVEVEDEYGDHTYKVTFASNNPMYQMYLTNILPEDCREVVLEVTARRLSDSGYLRVHMYDFSCGMSHLGPASFYHAIKEEYRKYRFRVPRINSGKTALGIGPSKEVGTSIQFKKARIFIPDERSKECPILEREYHGYLDGLNFPSLEAVELSDGRLAGTDDFAVSDGMYLDTVDLYSPAGLLDLTFKVGNYDQYGLFQEREAFVLPTHNGANHIKVDDRNIEVPAGCGVFIVWHSDLRLYRTDVGQPFRSLVSTTGNYFENTSGYSGYPLAETEYLVPLRYSLVSKGIDKRLLDVEETAAQVGELAERVDALEESGSAAENALVAPNGVKYYLSVNEDGTLSTIRSIPNKAVVFGNSLTLGFGTFGMAASDSRHDYFYYVKEFLTGLNADLEMVRYSASSWEGGTTSDARKATVEGFLQKLDGTEDLIIIQLSDNVNTDEKKATYAEDAKTMVSMFRAACPKARILWVAAWYGWSSNYAAIEAAAELYGIDIVDIRDLSTVAENKSAVGNTYTKDDGSVAEITDAGVASHPGDLGMKLIADRVIAKLGSYI